MRLSIIPQNTFCRKPTNGYKRLDCILACMMKHLGYTGQPCRTVNKYGRRVGVYDPTFPVCDPWMLREQISVPTSKNPTIGMDALEECTQQCPEPCILIRWEARVLRASKLSKVVLSKLWNSTEKAVEIVENQALLSIYMERLQETRIRQYFSFSLEMLVGQIGGFIGLFLGGSLISIVHVFVFTLHSMVFRCKPRTD